MNKALLALVALAAGALLIPNTADAQRGGRGFGGFGGGGIRMGGISGGPSMGGIRSLPRVGGSMSGPRMWYPPRVGGVGGPQFGTGRGFRPGAIAARPGALTGITPGPGSFRQAAINNPGIRFGNREDWRYGVRPVGSWGGRYPYYRGRYPYHGGRYPYYGRYDRHYPYYGGYYGGWGWGLATGALIGAAATYPYYDYPYDDYSYPTYETPTYETPVAEATGGYCMTPVRTCALINPAPIGTGCSCRISGGRARGTVQ